MYFTYPKYLCGYYGGDGSVQRWQFLTHKNFLPLKCPRKSSHAWFTYLNFFQDKNIQRRKHLKLIVQLKWKCLQNLSLTGFTQNKSLCSLEIWGQKWAKQLLKKGFRLYRVSHNIVRMCHCVCLFKFQQGNIFHVTKKRKLEEHQVWFVRAFTYLCVLPVACY